LPVVEALHPSVSTSFNKALLIGFAEYFLMVLRFNKISFISTIDFHNFPAKKIKSGNTLRVEEFKCLIVEGILTSTFQHFNISTFQHFNSSTFQHFNTSTHSQNLLV
jgi:hypothetical protein